jgi:hypothetical protein
LESLYALRKNVTQQIAEISNPSVQINKNQCDIDSIKKKVEGYLYEFVLTEKTLKLFVKRIEIGYLEKNTNGVRQKIKIYYSEHFF